MACPIFMPAIQLSAIEWVWHSSMAPRQSGKWTISPWVWMALGSRNNIWKGRSPVGNRSWKDTAVTKDPLIDLGWILATWRSQREVDIGILKVEPFDGFPTAAELIDRYASQSDRDLSCIDWYVVMACFKLAIILEGTFARAQAGLDPMATGLRLHTAAERLCARALERIG